MKRELVKEVDKKYRFLVISHGNGRKGEEGGWKERKEFI